MTLPNSSSWPWRAKNTLATRPMPAMSRSPRCRWPSKKLEEELDVKLFERSAGEVTVTPLGEEIVRQAQSVLEQAAAIKEIAKRGKDPLAGPDAGRDLHHRPLPAARPGAPRHYAHARRCR